MIVIYHCYGGAHSSVVAAAVHLGLLPQDRPPTARELCSIRYFDKQDQSDHGRIRPMGTDAEGHAVFLLGRRNCPGLLERSVREVARHVGVGTEDVRFVDTMPCVNWFMRLGGFTSRVLRLPALGRPVVIHGTRLAYPCLKRLAARTREGLREKVAPG
ncbi:MAG: DUF3189 family protein [Bacillota bacterium]|jgi:hypothetical protein